MKRVLVTGAAGFIGFHTALALHRRGDFVLGLDNFNDYYDPALKAKRNELLKKSGIEVIKGDLCDRALLKEIAHKNEFTHFLHLAAQAGVRYAERNPDAYLKSNLEGFLSILEICRLFPHVKLVYASSSSVYGCNEKTPFSVHDVTDKPANLYAATKKANELMAYSYHHLYGIEATGLRYFTVYGPWGRPDMAYYIFTKAIFESKPLTLFNEGKMSRDFTYIDDVVEGTLAALEVAGLNIFNIGNHKPESVMKMIEILENLCGERAIKHFEGESRGEVMTTWADIEESSQRLGFFPKVSLEEGLAKFVTWYRDHRLI